MNRDQGIDGQEKEREMWCGTGGKERSKMLQKRKITHALTMHLP